MSQGNSKARDSLSPLASLGDLTAMLRVMRPWNEKLSPEDLAGKRRMLADLCRFIGVQLGTVPRLAVPDEVAEVKPATSSRDTHPFPADSADRELAPRLRQTLEHLLDGDSEKQVAYKLKLSPHTVHVYVKSLYRRFNVSSRAELMSRYLKR